MAIVSFLETEDHDLALEAGNLVLCRDARAVAAHVETRFRFFLGEWFLDTREGVPYLEIFFVKNPDVSVLKQILRYVIVTTPGIADLVDFSLSYVPDARQVTYQFLAVADDGTTVEGGSAFVVFQPET